MAIMIRILLTIWMLAISISFSAQAYMKVLIDRGDTSNNCDTKIELIPYQTQPPYVITWWDNHWQPSTGLHAENVCEETILTTEILDINCRHLRAATRILPDSVPQVYLDTVIAILPSAPGMCDGSILFRYQNVSPSYTRIFGNSGSGGVTSDSIFTNLCEDYYTYSIYQGSVIGEVTVSLHYAPVLPCAPFRDSLLLVPQTGPGSCNGKVFYNTIGATGGTPYYHNIYKPVGGGSVQVNSNGPFGVDTSSFFGGLCSGPHIIETRSYPNNNYFVSNTIFVDNPLINDSVWGTPASPQIDTIYLSAITNCGINYSFNVDSAFISNMTHIGSNQYEIEITVLQMDSLLNQDTILSYVSTVVDTSHQLLFDITFFCADSDNLFRDSNKKAINNELHSYIYFPTNTIITGIDKSQYSSINLYPNPSSGDIMLTGLSVGLNNVNIFNLEGRMLLNQHFNSSNFKLNLSDFNNGTYILKIENNNQFFYKKIIIIK